MKRKRFPHNLFAYYIFALKRFVHSPDYRLREIFERAVFHLPPARSWYCSARSPRLQDCPSGPAGFGCPSTRSERRACPVNRAVRISLYRSENVRTVSFAACVPTPFESTNSVDCQIEGVSVDFVDKYAASYYYSRCKYVRKGVKYK